MAAGGFRSEMFVTPLGQERGEIEPGGLLLLQPFRLGVEVAVKVENGMRLGWQSLGHGRVCGLLGDGQWHFRLVVVGSDGGAGLLATQAGGISGVVVAS